MSSIWLPPDSDIALAARGWPGPGVKPKDFEVNFSHPLVPDANIIIPTLSGKLRDYKPGNIARPSTDGTGNTYGVVDGEEVFSMSGTATNRTGDFSDVARSGTDNWSIVFRVKAPSSFSAYEYISAHDGPVWASLSHTNAGGDLILYDGSIQDTDYDTQLNEWVNVVFAMGGGSVDVFVNGTFQKTITTSSTNTTGNRLNLANALSNNANTASSADLSFYGVYNRKLTAVDAAELNKNPFCFLRPANDTPYLISIPGGGAGTTPTLSTATFNVTGQTTATVGCTVTF